MAELDHAAKIGEWKSGYARLLDISEQQLVLIKSGELNDAILDQLRQLGEDRQAIQEQMESLQSELEGRIGSSELKAVFRQEIQSLAESARVLTFEAAYKIETMMISTGSELQTAKAHRKLFDAYSGIQSDDQISYYFDERK
ncbi:hypothetical protein [Cohnella hongkongensis]|uniref:Uncharacterized protein n=1 Tax=Cohnella hongkongensis TaxID=178337 RepID=A0ABV9FFY0_9BACL